MILEVTRLRVLSRLPSTVSRLMMLKMLQEGHTKQLPSNGEVTGLPLQSMHAEASILSREESSGFPYPKEIEGEGTKAADGLMAPGNDTHPGILSFSNKMEATLILLRESQVVCIKCSELLGSNGPLHPEV